MKDRFRTNPGIATTSGHLFMGLRHPRVRMTPDPNPPKIEKPKPQRIPGQGHYGPKTISFEEVQAMREEHKNGAKPKEISKKFGHEYCYVLRILNFEARVWG